MKGRSLAIGALLLSGASPADAHNILINTGRGLLENCTYESDSQPEIEYHFGLCVGFIKGVGNAWAIRNDVRWCINVALDNRQLTAAIVTRLRLLPDSTLDGPSAPMVIAAMESAFPC